MVGGGSDASVDGVTADRSAKSETVAEKVAAVEAAVKVPVEGDRSALVLVGSNNVFQSLDREWVVAGRSRAARTSLQRWAAAEAALAGFASPVEVVERCQRRGDQDGSNALLAAVLRQAKDDPIARHTILMAVLPGLAALSSRTRWLVGGDLGAWSGIEQLDQEVLTAALERVAAMAGSSHKWPAATIVSGVRESLRKTERRQRRRQAPLASLSEAETCEAPAEPTGPEAYASLIIEAVRRGALSRERAAIIYTTRVLGHTPEELATASGRDVRAVRAQRARAERTLIASGC